MAATSIDVLYNMKREKKHSLNDDEMKIISELQSKYQEDDLQKYLDNMLDIAFAFDTSTALKSFIIDVIKETRENILEFKVLTNNLLINERYLPHSSNAINFSSVSMQVYEEKHFPVIDLKMSDIKSCSFFENKNGGDINDYLLVSCLGNGDDFGLSQRAFADMLLTKTSSIPGFINVLDVFYHKEIYPEKGDLSIDYIFVITNPITQLTIEDFMELEKEERLDFAFNQVLPKVLARVKYLHDRNITFRGRLQLENIFRTDFFDGIALTVPASFNEDELNAYKELTETWAIDNSTHEVCPAPERWLKTYKEKPKDKNEEVERYKAMDIFAIGLLFIRMLSNDFRHTKSTIAVFPLINLLFELDSSHVQDDIVEQRTDGVVQKKSSSVDLTVNNIRLTDEYLDFLRYTLCPIAGARLTADQLLQRFFNDARTVLPVKTLDAHHPTIKFEPKNYCNQLGPLFYFYSRFHQEPSLRKLAFLQFLSKDNVERAKEMEIMKPEFKAAISEFHGPFFPLFFKFVSNLDTKQKDPILAMAEKDFPKMGGHKAK